MNSLLSGLILFSSFAMRTPNNPEIKVDDYELSLGFKSKTMNFKRDWERELGEKYVDDELWFEFKPGFLYIKPQYVNKTSRDLQYGKVDTRLQKDGYSFGYTGFYSEENLESGISLGVHKTRKINGTLSMEAKWDGCYFRDEALGIDRFDMEETVSLNWKLTEKLILNNVFDYNDIKDKKYYKFKIGLEYKL